MRWILVSLVCLGTPLAATVAAAQAQAVPDLQGVRELGARIDVFQTDALAFLGRWNSTGTACAQASRIPFGNLRTPCREIRTALRNGEFLLFARSCVELGDLHNLQVAAWRAAAEPPLQERELVESALIGNEAKLIAACSPATWREEYPEFAALRVEAAAPRYRLRSNRFYAANPDHRLMSTLESTLNATDAGTAREDPVTGTGSFATGSNAGSD